MNKGDTHIVVYLSDVDEEEVEQIASSICDVLSLYGLAIDRADEDAPVRALVGIVPKEFPDFDEDDIEATKEWLSGHAHILIPIEQDLPGRWKAE